MENLNKLFAFTLIFISLFLFQSCDVVFGIFEAGLWVGIIISIIVVALAIFILVKIFQWLRRR